jgi:hypothetical protein
VSELAPANWAADESPKAAHIVLNSSLDAAATDRGDRIASKDKLCPRIRRALQEDIWRNEWRIGVE